MRVNGYERKLAASFTKVVGILSAPHALPPFFYWFKRISTSKLLTDLKTKAAESFDLMYFNGLLLCIDVIFSACLR